MLARSTKFANIAPVRVSQQPLSNGGLYEVEFGSVVRRISCRGVFSDTGDDARNFLGAKGKGDGTSYLQPADRGRRGANRRRRADIARNKGRQELYVGRSGKQSKQTETSDSGAELHAGRKPRLTTHRHDDGRKSGGQFQGQSEAGV